MKGLLWIDEPVRRTLVIPLPLSLPGLATSIGMLVVVIRAVSRRMCLTVGLVQMALCRLKWLLRLV